MAVDWWALGIFTYELLAGYPPFHGATYLETYDQILDGIYSVPSFFSPEAQDLISRLLEPSRSLRLGNLVDGVGDLKRHSFFRSLDWDKLYRKEIDPPAIPTLNGDGDYSHFDLSDIENTPVPDGPKKPCPMDEW